MEIQLIELKLKNFKGVKDRTIQFNDAITEITGKNASGKTTIFDAFTWLLFNKNSEYQTDFNVQPLNEKNEVIHRIETEVTGILKISNGNTEKDVTLTKILQEKWVKKTGETEKKLTGTKTSYEINEVPAKQKDYQKYISELLDEGLFKMITNPLYFPNIKWETQRDTLLKITGDVSDIDVICYDSDLYDLKQYLDEECISNLKEKTKNQIQKLNKNISNIPARVDECNNQITEGNTDELSKEKSNIISLINEIDEKMSDCSKVNEEKLKLQNELYKAKRDKEELNHKLLKEANKDRDNISFTIDDLTKKLNNNEYEIKQLNRKIEDSEYELKRNTMNIESLEEEKEKLKQEFKTVKQEEYISEEFVLDENSTKCPTCGREYDNVEEIKDNLLKIHEENEKNSKKIFEQNQNRKLKEINVRGKSIVDRINRLQKYNENEIDSRDSYKEKIEKLSEQNDILIGKIDLLRSKQTEEVTKVTSPILDSYDTTINELENRIAALSEGDNTELKAQKNKYLEQIDSINVKIAAINNNDKLKERIEELLKEEKELNSKKVSLERIVILCDKFIKTKVEMLEDRINSIFNNKINIKLFKELVNGSVKECCEITVNGVPYKDLNNGMKINAGLIMINALCKYYNVYAPIFVDNAESVNRLVDTKSQLIKLVVTENDLEVK